MRRAGNLYERIAGPENLALAFWKAQRGKTAKPEVAAFREDLAGNLACLREELLARRARVGEYHYFTIHDPKDRVICAASFRERVLHHAIMNVCEPWFEAYQISDSYACRKGKGVDACLARARSFCRRAPWYLKLDVHKYFDSIDHDVLTGLLARRFKDADLLRLFRAILDTYETAPGKGIPIGNLTSQYFANLYLGALDHEVKDAWRIPAYIRYMDDFVLFGEDKATMAGLLGRTEDFLASRLKLSLNAPILNRTPHGIPFLGYRVLGGCLRLSEKAKRRFRRKMGRALEEGAPAMALPLLAFIGRADSFGFRQRFFYGNTPDGSVRVKRGGSWNNNAQNARSAYRNRNAPGTRNNNIGFRVAAPAAAAQRMDGCPHR